MPARQAEQLGMIWKAVPDAELSGEVDGLLANLKARPRLSAGLCKQLVNRAAASSCEDQLASEARCQAVAGTSVDYRESVFAFVEKRKPVFE